MSTRLVPVPSDLLEALAASVPAPPAVRREVGQPGVATFDLERWIETHAEDISGPTPWQGGRRWVFNVCPWNSEHRNRSAFIIQFASGAIGAGCHHYGCLGESWQTLRDLLEPGRRPARGGSVSPPVTAASAGRDDSSGPGLELSSSGDHRPEIDAAELDLPKITSQAWEALLEANDPPELFRQGGSIVRIETGEEGQPLVRTVTRDRLRHRLARIARWTRPNRNQTDTAKRALTLPPAHVVGDVLATPDPPLPVLTRIVEAPTFAADGTLQTTPGYHAASRSYYAPQTGLVVPPIPSMPTAEDLAQARQFIVDELLHDFPFVTTSERAHAVALLLLPFVRELIGGPTPLHLIDKPSPGTGATLLSEMLTYPAMGRAVAALTEGRDEDEWRKRITAKLCSGGPIVLIDNLRQPLDSAAVAAAITATYWEDRRLGASELVQLPVRCVWMATGNNVVLSNEITRRTIRIRLDASLDQPWLRTGFRHQDLRGWAREHRGDLIWAALTIGQAWLAAGRPRGHLRLGMFEEWVEVMGGMLGVAGIPGFLGNLDEFYAASDAEQAVWHVFFTAWWERFGDGEVGVADLVEVAEGIDPPLEIGDGSERSQRTRLGKLLGKMRDRQVRIQLDDDRIGQVRLVDAGTSHNTQRWRLIALVGDVGDVGGRFSSAAAATADSHSLSACGVAPDNVPHVPQRPPNGLDGIEPRDSEAGDDWGEI